MSLLSIEELKELVEQPQGVCVSIYMPTMRLGSETQQNPIRFKNLIKQAEARLQEYDLRPTDAANLLQPAVALDEENFWQHQDAGLAIFIAEGFFRYYRLPLELEELVVVNDSFHLKPLMPLLTGDGRFYILTLGQRDVRLLECTQHSVIDVEVEGLPKNMDEALQYDETAKEGQRRMDTGAGRNQQGGSFHGQGNPDRDNIQQELLQYFHLVDRALHEFFHTRRAPLVLAGVDYLLPIYREANTYGSLMTEGIKHNTKLQTPEELRDEAWTLVEPEFQQAQQKAIDYYYDLSATGKTSTDLNEVISGAFYGRVEQLFVPVGVQKWGNFDTEAMELQMHTDAQPGDEDLLNAAAIQTLFHGGIVYAVEPEKVPDSAPVAAVFRY